MGRGPHSCGWGDVPMYCMQASSSLRPSAKGDEMNVREQIAAVEGRLLRRKERIGICTTEISSGEGEVLIATIRALEAALKLALEYWGHRQQRYKNRAPVWVMEARAALARLDNDMEEIK